MKIDNSLTLIIAVALFLILATGIAAKWRQQNNSVEKQRLRRHPVSCTIFHAIYNFHRIYHYTTDLSSKRSSFRLLHLLRSFVITTDPANVEHILKTNFPNYSKGWFHRSILTDFLGDGIFTADGEHWQRQRKVSSYEFSTKILRDHSTDVFRTNASKLAHKISVAAQANQSIEFQDLMMKSALDTVFTVLLGMNLDSIDGTNKESVQFSDAFDEANALITFRYLDIFWKAKRFLNMGSEATLKKHVKLINHFLYKVIRFKCEQEQKSQEHPLPMKKGDILSHFLELGERDPKFLRDITLSFIIAGKDTTAITLCWFIYIMCKYPSIQEKIAKEVEEITGVKGWEDSGFDKMTTSISEDALNKMNYLHATLTETLRLYPPVPIDGKLCVSEDKWPDGFTVSEGDIVLYIPYSMGRMKNLWGDDAEAFRPERWLNEDGIFQPASPFKFIAFNAGPRICLGKEFAYRQMKIFSAALISAFTFKLSDEKRDVNYKAGLTLRIDGGLHVTASNRV